MNFFSIRFVQLRSISTSSVSVLIKQSSQVSEIWVWAYACFVFQQAFEEHALKRKPSYIKMTSLFFRWWNSMMTSHISRLWSKRVFQCFTTEYFVDTQTQVVYFLRNVCIFKRRIEFFYWRENLIESCASWKSAHTKAHYFRRPRKYEKMSHYAFCAKQIETDWMRNE